ncbi:RNA polymerase IIA largest subunit, partial [Angomonas deanei]
MPLQKVHEVQFEVFKEKQIKDYAVCRIDKAKSFENGIPVRGGINDLRMGTTDFDNVCETCNMRHPDCPGHFGYVELAEPLFNIGVFDLLLLTLKCVCKNCGELLLNRSDETIRKKLVHLHGLNRLRMAAKLCGKECKSTSAMGCGMKQHNIGRVQGIYPGIMVKATLDEKDELWYGDMIYQIFDRVSNESAAELGFKPEFCHPRDLLITVLPVPPPQVRPAISFGSMKSDDELTHQIMTILKQNITLRTSIETDNKAHIERSRALLQESVANYFNNSSTYYKPTKMSDTKKLKSLTERLKGKYGRLRGNLMGKRVDFSARTVITGDPNIDVDEVGVP